MGRKRLTKEIDTRDDKGFDLSEKSATGKRRSKLSQAAGLSGCFPPCFSFLCVRVVACGRFMHGQKGKILLSSVAFFLERNYCNSRSKPCPAFISRMTV
jgi:hypothetical protein